MISLRVLCLNIFRTTNTQSDIASLLPRYPIATQRGEISANFELPRGIRAST
jgi:hypothetical protein